MSFRTKVNARAQDGVFFWILMALIVVTAVFYIYCVNRTVVLVAGRNSMQSLINENRGEITKLEIAYMQETGKITLNVANTLGYGEAANTLYIPKKTVSVLAQSTVQ